MTIQAIATRNHQWQSSEGWCVTKGSVKLLNATNVLLCHMFIGMDIAEIKPLAQ